MTISVVCILLCFVAFVTFCILCVAFLVFSYFPLPDSTIAIWDFAKLTNEAALEDVNVTHNPDVMKDSEKMMLGSYRSKTTPVLHLHFTRRNLLLTTGPFEG